MKKEQHASNQFPNGSCLLNEELQSNYQETWIIQKTSKTKHVSNHVTHEIPTTPSVNATFPKTSRVQTTGKTKVLKCQQPCPKWTFQNNSSKCTISIKPRKRQKHNQKTKQSYLATFLRAVSTMKARKLKHGEKQKRKNYKAQTQKH